MAFDRKLADRMRKILRKQKGFSERHMFGGIAFMLDGKMACGAIKDNLVARVGKVAGPELLKKPHVRPMDFTGRPMAGLLYVGPRGTRTAAGLNGWIRRCVAFARSLPRPKPRQPRPFRPPRT